MLLHAIMCSLSLLHLCKHRAHFYPRIGGPIIEVRGMPNGIFHPWVRWDSGMEVAGKFFRRCRRRRRRPPQKWVFGDYCFPSFLIHSRAMNVLASAHCREFRYGTFMFS